MKLSSAKATTGFGIIYTSSEEEEDNILQKKTMTKCSHRYHLGCIYEWMERSESCPVCSKVMAFDETT
ncbi:putative transcription factor C2H2 family [Rosa chinensis]|uniref:RING-type E3 ubiquitin transferase n=1 Tax=Rosa chinensis TaxID=74649 RepID=A0A2P6RYV3_ROSCH|nr:putative transcription factor C2H2 family [Rosa chinensis]